MNKQIINSAMQIITSRKHHAEAVASENLQQALLDLDFKQNYEEIKEGEIQNARAEVFGEKLPCNLTELQKKQDEILKKLNIKKQDITPNYHCTKCNDTGYTNGQMCTCLKEQINQELLKKSGFNHVLASFDDSKTDIFDNSKQMEQVYTSLKTWSNKQDSKFKNVILMGKTGVGKSHIMECIADAMIKNGQVIYFTSAFNFNQNLLKYHTTFDESKTAYISDMLECDCLFIDDLGTEAILKNVTQEGLYNIISERMLNNKKTVISTNLNPQQIETVYGERIFSRLMSRDLSLCLNIQNQDLRLKK